MAALRKISGLMHVWLLSLLGTSPVIASPQVLQGDSLGTPLTIELDFSHGSPLLISASQSHADFSLHLKEGSTGEILREVNFSWREGLDEILLVKRSECQDCVAVLVAREYVDQGSPYLVNIEAVVGSKAGQLESLGHLTLAGEFHGKAQKSKSDKKIALQKRTISELAYAAESAEFELRHHALTLLAEVSIDMDDEAQQLAALNTIYTETDGRESIFRVHALYDLAISQDDVVRERAMYDEGILIAKKLGHPRLYAMGINYKAISLVLDGQFAVAIGLLKEAETIFSETRRWRNLMYPLANLAWANQRAGALPASLAYATKQKLIAEQYKQNDSAVLALYNFAMTYGQMGDRFFAEQFLDEAIEKHSLLPESSSLYGATAHLLQEKAERLLEYGAYESAGDYAALVKTEFAKLGLPGKSADAKFLEGEIAFAKRDYPLAKEKFLAAVKYDRENKRIRQEGIHLLRLAALEMEQVEFIAAATYQAAAFRALSATEDKLSLSKAFSQSVELLHHLEADKEAEKLASRTASFIEQHGLEQEHARFAYRRALVAYGLGQNVTAIDFLEQARAIVEQTLPKIRRRDLRRTYLGLQKSIFELNIELLLAADPSEPLKPLALAETYKGRTLAESIQLGSAEPVEASAAYQERKSVITQIQTNALLWHGDSLQQENPQSLLAKTRKLSQTLEKLEVEISNQRAEPMPLVKEVSSDKLPSAKANELIAYYFIGKRRGWLWVITSDVTEVIELPSEQKLERLTSDVLAHIASAPSTRGNSGAWNQNMAMEALSDSVVRHLNKHLTANDIHHITIIPDGPLHGVPFAPLRLSKGASPLVTNYAVSYAPSLLINSALDKRILSEGAKSNLSIMVVADPVTGADSQLTLERLTHSAAEADAIRILAGDQTKVLLADSATKAQVLEQLAKPYSILHFATHGLLNSREPLLSGLAFSSINGSDSLWLSPEISSADILADLVILSACESSIGKQVSGEGLFSLSRAFIEGGANQVIGTLWKVQDRATASFTKVFYSSLLEDRLPVSSALRKAQMAIYLNENSDWADPYYWAGFQLQGGGANHIYAIDSEHQ